jgi:YrbI family 3-deoxy-D-manno-octulosonate 8-phosphate phosphatase
VSAIVDAIVMDVDGVLTDGGFWWSTSGDELKRFCFQDVMGISLGRRAGLSFGIVSGENSPLAERFAQKMSIVEVHLGIKDKGAALRLIAERQGIPLERICFIGDDVNDLSAMEIAGFSAAPANAQPAVLARADWPLRTHGGHGAVRELVEHVLAHHRPIQARQPT